MDHLSSCQKKKKKKMWILMEPGSGVQEVWGPPFEYGGQLTSDQTVSLKGQRVHASWTRSWFFWFTALFSLYWELYFTFLWYFQSTLTVLELRHTTKRVKYFLLTSKCETRPPYLLWRILEATSCKKTMGCYKNLSAHSPLPTLKNNPKKQSTLLNNRPCFQQR